MKNAIVTATLAIAMLISGAALADSAKPVKPVKANVDMTTTQSIRENQDCDALGTKFKYASCSKTEGNKYPENALSGLNLGF